MFGRCAKPGRDVPGRVEGRDPRFGGDFIPGRAEGRLLGFRPPLGGLIFGREVGRLMLGRLVGRPAFGRPPEGRLIFGRAAPILGALVFGCGADRPPPPRDIDGRPPPPPRPPRPMAEPSSAIARSIDIAMTTEVTPFIALFLRLRLHSRWKRYQRPRCERRLSDPRQERVLR